ncbi:MAG: hypothetical protein F6K65_29435 [Moorea sp. SIO3C2]|nr:hypothetical protein [Moorena sp. SIO3C2]
MKYKVLGLRDWGVCYTLYPIAFCLFRAKSWLVKASMNAIAFLVSLPKAMQCDHGGNPQDRTASRGATRGEFNSPTESAPNKYLKINKQQYLSYESHIQ